MEDDTLGPQVATFVTRDTLSLSRFGKWFDAAKARATPANPCLDLCKSEGDLTYISLQHSTTNSSSMITVDESDLKEIT